jgi:ribokinase
MTSKIVVVGSINRDIVVSTGRMPVLGETIQGEGIEYFSGGKGANQAVGAARLGAESMLIGAVGDDFFGQGTLRELEQSGVSTQCVETIAGTSTGVANIYRTSGDNCIVVIPGANGMCTPELVARYEHEIEQADILLTQLEIPMETVYRALSLAKQSGVTTVLNPAPAQELPEALLQLVDYITPNETEFAALSGYAVDTEAQLEQAMLEWKTRYNIQVIVTLGEKGCAYLQSGRMECIPGIKVQVADTTGAGDCFNGALSFGLAQGWELERCLRFAVRASALSVTKLGAQEGMPTYDEVLSYL